MLDVQNRAGYDSSWTISYLIILVIICYAGNLGSSNFFGVAKGWVVRISPSGCCFLSNDPLSGTVATTLTARDESAPKISQEDYHLALDQNRPE